MIRAYLAVLGSLIIFVQPSHASSSMRCGNDLVSLGDHVIEVLARCGEPAYVDERVIYHVKKIDHKHPHGRRDAHIRKEKHIPILAETWVYNFGPNRFMQEVWIVDRRLQRVLTLGRGYALPDGSSGLVGERPSVVAYQRRYKASFRKPEPPPRARPRNRSVVDLTCQLALR